jgi:hypothetical protein
VYSLEYTNISNGVPHATLQAVTSAGCFVDKVIRGGRCEPTMTSVPTVVTMYSNNYPPVMHVA